jgi:hypothetical protein
MNIDDRTTVLANQDSFDNWVVASNEDKAKVAIDILKDIVNADSQDNDKMTEASKVVGFYWGMV